MIESQSLTTTQMCNEAECRNVITINIHRNLRYGLFRIAAQFAVFSLANPSNCAFRLLPALLLLTAVLAPLLSWTTRPFMGTREHLSLPELVLYGTTTAVCCTADVCRWRLRLRMTRSELPFCLGCLHWKFHRGRRGISAVEQELIYHYQWIRYNPAGITG